VYKQSFSCKNKLHESQIDCNKLHRSPCETDRAWSRSLLQMRDYDPDSTTWLILLGCYDIPEVAYVVGCLEWLAADLPSEVIHTKPDRPLRDWVPRWQVTRPTVASTAVSQSSIERQLEWRAASFDWQAPCRQWGREVVSGTTGLCRRWEFPLSLSATGIPWELTWTWRIVPEREW